MNPKILEHLVYTLVIVVSLIALGLVALAPDCTDTQVAYQRF